MEEMGINGVKTNFLLSEITDLFTLMERKIQKYLLD